MDEEVLGLRARVEELEQRLAEVEKRVGIRPLAQPPPFPVLASPPAPPPPRPIFEPEPEPVAAAAARQAPLTDNVETKAGLVWVNRVGAITVILSVAFGFKYAVDNEWIGPGGRVMLGLLAGALALFAGDKLWQRGHRSFAQGITALGVAIFYLSFYAAYQLYNLIPQTVAFAGAAVTTAAAGALALRYDARAIAILALLGGYLSPALVASNEPNDRFFGGYLFVLNAIALTLVRLKRWFAVEMVAAVSTLILFVAWIDTAGHRLTPMEGSLFVALQFAIFASSPSFGVRAAAAVPSMVGVAYLCGQYASPAYWTWAALIAIVGLALAWPDGDDRLLLSSFAGWAVGFFAWNPELASHGSIFAGLFAGFLGYLGATMFLPGARRTLFTYSTLTANALFFYGVCYTWFDGRHHGYMGLLALLVAGCILGAAQHLKRSGAPREMLLVSAGLALSFVTLAIPIQLSGYSITLAWAVESAVLAFLAARFQSKWPFIGSGLIASLALALLFAQDAERAWGPDYSPILNARFVPFVVMAISLAANAYWTSRLKDMPRELALIPGLAAHFTLLAGLHLEIFAWIQSGHQPGADLTSRLTLASSLLLAVYGLALVAHGVSREFRAHRVLGLALFAIVVAKLYLFDIWQLGRLYRILAFVAIGGLLLSGSYLYSRYRHRLLVLLQDETRPS